MSDEQFRAAMAVAVILLLAPVMLFTLVLVMSPFPRLPVIIGAMTGIPAGMILACALVLLGAKGWLVPKFPMFNPPFHWLKRKRNG